MESVNNLNFLPNIKKAEIEKALDDPEWQDDIANAVFFAATHLDPMSTTIMPEQLSLAIINYNVTKRLHSLYKENLPPLPKEVYWSSKISQREAFDSLESFVTYFDLAKPELKKAAVTFVIEDDLIKFKLKHWCERIAIHFDNKIKIEYKQLKAKNKYKIQLS